MPLLIPSELAGATRQQAIAIAQDLLRSADVEQAHEDARRLVIAACGMDALALVRDPDATLSQTETALLAQFIDRRVAGEPVSRILGARPFWSVDLLVRPAVLDPRADSEAVIRLAKRCFEGRSPRNIMDLGSGSGALVCALLSEFEAAFGVAVDFSWAACMATRDNLRRCDLSNRSVVIQGDWARMVAGRFDLIVSNPPYIPTDEISRLPTEVRDHDPRLSLDGGPDGLSAYRAILDQARGILGPEGTMIVECGWNQRQDVQALAQDRGLVVHGVESDLGGHERAIAFGVA